MRPYKQRSRGSITLVALCLAIVIAISLASYLALCRQSLQLSTRTMHLDRARQLAETGLEEALWALNNGSAGTWNQSGPNSGVTWSGTASTQRTCSLPGPSKPDGYDLGQGAKGTLVVTVDFASPYSAHTPKITSVATVDVPGQGTFTKTLTADAKPTPLFPNAIGVLNGNLSLPTGTVIDSWDSDYNAAAIAPTPKHDYNAATAPVAYSLVPPVAPNLIDPLNCNAVIAATNITLAGTCTVYGYVTTKGNPITYTSGSSKVKGPITPVGTDIDPVRVAKSAFLPSLTVSAPTPPSGNWTNLPTNAAWGASFSIINSSTINPVYYAASSNESGMSTYNGGGNDLLLDGTKTLVIEGYVILYIEEDFELKDSAKIIIQNPGSRLEIYARDDVSISGTAGFDNQTGEPKNLALFCTSQFSSDFGFTYSSSAAFNGVIDTVDTNEGAVFSSTMTFSGALLAGYTPTISGALTLHYDTALQYLPKGWFKGVTTPFMLEQITETP